MFNSPYRTTVIPNLKDSLWSRGNFNSFLYVADADPFIWRDRNPGSKSKRRESDLTLVVGIVWPTQRYGQNIPQKLLFFRTIIPQSKFWPFIVHDNSPHNAADFSKQNFVNNNGKFFKILFHYKSVKGDITTIPAEHFHPLIRNEYGKRRDFENLSIDWE